VCSVPVRFDAHLYRKLEHEQFSVPGTSFAVSYAVVCNSLPTDRRVLSLTAATLAGHSQTCLFSRPVQRIRGLFILRYTNARIIV